MKEHFQTGSATQTIDSTCPAPPAGTTYSDTDILMVYTNGIITAGLLDNSEFYDTTNNRLTNVASYVQSRTGATGSYLKPRANINSQTGNAASGTGSAEFVRDQLNTLVSDDNALAGELKNEYCHYHARYTFSLNRFLNSIVTTSTTEKAYASKYLTQTITLNRRLNAMLEIMDYLGKQRVSFINAQSALIDTTGQLIANDLQTMQLSADKLNSKNAILETQQEMMRFTQEKNNHIRNQISLWASLNIVALGVIFYVYRQI
jgi:hypothetical protein